MPPRWYTAQPDEVRSPLALPVYPPSAVQSNRGIGLVIPPREADCSGVRPPWYPFQRNVCDWEFDPEDPDLTPRMMSAGVAPVAPPAPPVAPTVGTFSTDGAWTWFTDPRAVVHEGSRRQMYAGYIRGNGDVMVGSYDLDSHVIREFNLHAALVLDDHSNPSLYVAPDGRITAFYCKHPDTVMRARTTLVPEDISAWSAERTNVPNIASGTSGYSYSNPIYLSAEGRLFLFFRGNQWSPTLTYSDDGGATWAPARELMTRPGSERPYVKYASNSVDRIDFWATLGHPRDNATTPNHIVHFFYWEGAFYNSAGVQIDTFAGAPVAYQDATQVHDATTAGAGWTWSIEYDGSGFPVCTYTVFPPATPDVHEYRVAWWDGAAWQRALVLLDGPDLYPPADNAEPQYSGGIVLDPDDTTRLFISRPIGGQWEIESRVSADGRLSWPVEWQYTAGSAGKNARPYVPRNRAADGPQLLWWAGAYASYTSFDADVIVSPALESSLGAEPLNTVAPVISGTPQSGQVLTCTQGTWTGAAAFAFQWRRNGVVIAGEVAATHTVAPADEGKVVDCYVTATNTFGKATAVAAEVVVPVPGGGYAALISATSGLVAYYRLGDAPGSGVAVANVGANGSVIGGVTFGQAALLTGEADTAALFNGTTGVIQLPDLSLSETKNYSFEAWFKSTDAGTDRWMVTHGSTLSVTPMAGLILHSTKLRGYWRGTSGADVIDISSAAVVNDGQRHHGAVTMDGATLRLYLDGAQVNSVAIPSGAQSVNTAAIGALIRATTAQWFPGTLDEVAFYNRALTPVEVAAHFTEGSS